MGNMNLEKEKLRRSDWDAPFGGRFGEAQGGLEWEHLVSVLWGVLFYCFGKEQKM